MSAIFFTSKPNNQLVPVGKKINELIQYAPHTKHALNNYPFPVTFNDNRKLHFVNFVHHV